VRLIDSAHPTVEKLGSILSSKSLHHLSNGRAHLSIYVSDKPRNFTKVGEGFLGEKLHSVEVVRR